MKVRALFSLAAAVGITAGSASAQAPAAAPVNPNQQLADAVAARLKVHPAIAGADLSVTAQDGKVRLIGTTGTAEQKTRLITEVRGVTGVVLVEDGLTVRPLATVTPVQYPVPPVPPAHVGGGNPIVEPAPLGVPGAITPDLSAPPLPPYAWPTYAPYNNVSRVGYPEAYPYNAFPFIGPYYPFPKVPLGWRKVTLEWEDGHWYLGRNSAPHDYWKVRFW